jgi:hypothetical protein
MREAAMRMREQRMERLRRRRPSSTDAPADDDGGGNSPGR